MLFFYDLGIRLYQLILFILTPFNEKARLWRQGRKGLLDHIASINDRTVPCFWFHFPSLGEFEQGRPVLEKLKRGFPGKKVIVTFFSPSGYLVRKGYAEADHVFYLPADTALNARQFIDLVNPELVVFTKYDYWYHYFNEINARDIPLFVISAIFNKKQAFFKPYGALHRKMLSFITCIFVQDEASKQLLKHISINNVKVSGDTRFDRVIANASQVKRFPLIEKFAGQSPVFIAGSTWPKDEQKISELADAYPRWKFILAPHEIHRKRISSVLHEFHDKEIVRYSRLSDDQLTEGQPPARILLIDNIGMLASLYQYGHIAYIGGGFGTGLHNTLEAAAFNLPVIFGPEYHRFNEAVELTAHKAAFSISTSEELRECMTLLSNDENAKAAGQRAGDYVRQNTGATKIITNEVEQYLRPGESAALRRRST